MLLWWSSSKSLQLHCKILWKTLTAECYSSRSLCYVNVQCAHTFGYIVCLHTDVVWWHSRDNLSPKNLTEIIITLLEGMLLQITYICYTHNDNLLTQHTVQATFILITSRKHPVLPFVTVVLLKLFNFGLDTNTGVQLRCGGLLHSVNRCSALYILKYLATEILL